MNPALQVEVSTGFAVLSWGVKASFCRYVAGLSDGACDLSGGVRLLGSGLYGLPGEATFEGATFTWRSQESIRFSGHGGALDVHLLAPSLHVTPSVGSLCVIDPGGDAERMVIADVEVLRLTPDGATLRPRLTEAGVAMFGGNYPLATALDDLHVILRPGVPGSPI